MACHDPISDMLTKIRNAMMAKKEKVNILLSREKLEIIKIFKNEGFIKNFKKITEDGKVYIRVFLKYNEDGTSVIRGVKRISKTGRRIYKGYKELDSLYNNMGVIVISTSQGITTTKKAIEKQVGGELLCSMW